MCVLFSNAGAGAEYSKWKKRSLSVDFVANCNVLAELLANVQNGQVCNVGNSAKLAIA